ncbi:MAG: hypothetical protein EGQ46_01110 [Clostridiales bacterium]|jgi:hypothetical protein|nr:hypothetical protein [Clostridiales bacterium]
MKRNETIRGAARSKGVRMWQIAETLGINEAVFSRKLRHELPEKETQKILAVIAQLAKEDEEADE